MEEEEVVEEWVWVKKARKYRGRSKSLKRRRSGGRRKLQEMGEEVVMGGDSK
ncbi:uncharacterized protein G2W53_022958 [Senna tora]|uniref:Uncharacterized protein n=1 Tax=Senna tora TaxID=362788 RepID=A0A834TNR9_9FABA|nr:uncharacterized protein G2W53_022958 [Senna tora]